MSKSKNNGVDPQSMIGKYGADTVRLFSLFASPPDQSLEWNEAGVEGMSRFRAALCGAICMRTSRSPITVKSIRKSLDAKQKTMRRQTHETIAKVSDDYRPPLRVQHGHRFVHGIAECAEQVRRHVRAGPRRAPRSVRVDGAVADADHAAYLPGVVERARPRRSGSRSRVADRRTRTRCAKTRSNSRCRSTASCAARSKCRSMRRAKRSKPLRWRMPTSRITSARPPSKKIDLRAGQDRQHRHLNARTGMIASSFDGRHP